MQIVKNNIVITILFLLVSSTFYAQNSIQGDIANWANCKFSILFDDDVSPEIYLE